MSGEFCLTEPLSDDEALAWALPGRGEPPPPGSKAGPPALNGGEGALARGCECPVCHEPLFEAYVSPCGHAACLGCATRFCALPKRHWDSPRAHEVPRCPVCRAAVHLSQYRRCYALEETAQALYPRQWEAHAVAAEKKRGGLPPAPGGSQGLAELRTWKAVREEQAVENAVQCVWSAIRGGIDDSTALIFSRAGACLQGAAGRGERGERWAAVRSGHERPLVRAVPLLEEEPDGELQAYEQHALRALWTSPAEVRRRLEARGLTLIFFRNAGGEHAFVTWPELPSPFAGS